MIKQNTLVAKANGAIPANGKWFKDICPIASEHYAKPTWESATATSAWKPGTCQAVRGIGDHQERLGAGTRIVVHLPLVEEAGGKA